MCQCAWCAGGDGLDAAIGPQGLGVESGAPGAASDGLDAAIGSQGLDVESGASGGAGDGDDASIGVESGDDLPNHHGLDKGSDDGGGIADLGHNDVRGPDAHGLGVGSGDGDELANVGRNDAGVVIESGEDSLEALPDSTSCAEPQRRRVAVDWRARSATDRIHAFVLPTGAASKRLRVQQKRVLENLSVANAGRLRDDRALAEAWNDTRLRVGEQVASTAEEVEHDKFRTNQWDHQSVVRLAFNALGNSSTHHSRDTSRELVVFGAASRAAQCAQKALVDMFVDSLESGRRKLEWLVVSRAWDATPTEVVFGDLSGTLCEHG